MPEPIANAVKVLNKSRYALLAGAMLATLAVPQWSAASDAGSGIARDGSFVVAQRVDPNEQKGKQKGAQGQQPQGQQKQFGKQPGGGANSQNQTQQGGSGQQGAPGTPGQRQFGKQSPSGSPGPQNQFGKGSPSGPGGQGNQAQQGGPGQPGARGPEERKQLGKQPLGGSQGEVGQQGGPGQPGGAGAPGQQKQFGNDRRGNGPQFGKQTPGTGQQPTGGQSGSGPQFGKQTPGSGQPPAGGQQPLQGNLQPRGPGAGTASLEQLHSQRHEHVEAGGRTVIEEPGNRLIVRDNTGRAFIAHDEGERFRVFAPNARVERRGSESFTTFERPGGIQIINVTDANGHLLRRLRRGPDGREIVLIENRGPGFGTGLAVGLAAGLVGGVAAGVFLDLPPPVITIPREQYIVDAAYAQPVALYDTLAAPPLVAIERPYSLDEIRYNVALRDRMRRIDIDTINFEFGSWEVAPEESARLTAIAGSIQRVLTRNPDEVFMIEGYTDAVGSDEDNLSLSDRRAESIATLLSQQYQIAPENLVTQGYGKQFLKIPTPGPSRENRRVAVRRITPLLRGQQAALR